MPESKINKTEHAAPQSYTARHDYLNAEHMLSKDYATHKAGGVNEGKEKEENEEEEKRGF